MEYLRDTPTARQGVAPMVHTSPIAYRHQSTSPRRRMMGPRDMRGSESLDDSPGDSPSARNGSPSPVRRGPREECASGDMCLDEGGAPPRSISSNALSKRARPEVEPSPRPSPAKKMASRLSTEASLSASMRAAGRDLFAAPSEAAENRPSRRVVSSASVRAVRASSPPRHGEQPDVFSSPQVSAPVEPAVPAVDATFLDDEPMVDVSSCGFPGPQFVQQALDMREATQAPVQPFDLLRKHVDDMRLKLSRELANANKENERIVSPTALTRSPQTRNVFVGDFAYLNSATILD